MSMNMHKPVYWHKNQVAIKFQKAFTRSSTIADIRQGVQNFQDQLNNVVLAGTQFTVQRLTGSSRPQAAASSAPVMPASTDDLSGVYLFPSPVTTIDMQGHSDAVIFYDIFPRETSTASGMTGTSSMSNMPAMSGTSDMSSMQGNGGSNAMGNDSTTDHTLDLVNYLRNYKNTSQQANSSDYDAIPNWLWSGTDDVTHGCPVSPPIPVETNDAPGQWKITLPEVSNPSLQDATGKGVTVFILDTLPPADKISAAAQSAGNANTLLQSMVAGMVSDGSSAATPPAISLNYSFDIPDPSQTAMTGKDIYGQLVGFPMADHGLCIAGIVRDLAPDANIECIRVLNDYGVGTVDTLMNALKSIQARVRQGGDLFQKPVVINLSLVVLPPGNDQDIQNSVPKDGDIMKSTLQILSTLIQGVAHSGVVIFVASAGNDSDPRDTVMNPNGVRYWPRYPAYFAYDKEYNVSQIIPVGAVNQYGEASSYSNYPGPDGIAAYAGETPSPYPPVPPQDTTTQVTVEQPVDELCGVYCSGWYPQLTMGPMQPMSSPSQYPMYQVPASNTWAYWTGTSFAVPIISALAARVLETEPTLPSGADLRQTILSAAAQETIWIGLETGDDASGPAIMATQDWCPSN